MATAEENEQRLARLETEHAETKRRLLQLETDIIGDCIQLGKRWWKLLLHYEPEEAERIGAKRDG